MANFSQYNDHYESSHAIIIGIDEYEHDHIENLKGCVKDAEVIRQAIISFGFDRDKIDFLYNQNATKKNILKTYLSFVKRSKVNDRLFVFCAGHGHFVDGIKGRVGYLVPSDGLVNDLSTLVSWREFHEGSGIIPAKHVLFILDTCFSGTFFSQGRNVIHNNQLLKDALLRPVRQAISSGKTDQIVDDNNGSLVGHSLFASYLIRGLNGGARIDREPLYASSLANYLIKNVGQDPKSYQTPEYGKIDGDGDFVFDKAPSKNNSWLKPSDSNNITVQTNWTGNVPDDFFRDQVSLDIFLKDGYGFFKNRQDILKVRLNDPNKITRIAILHPDFKYIDAVACMDPVKESNPSRQRLECLDSIRQLQMLVNSLITDKYDPRDYHHFRGYHVIPTWNGFIGDAVGAISMYFSRPYRGPLNLISFYDDDSGLFQSMKEDFDIVFSKEGFNKNNNLWLYDLSK